MTVATSRDLTPAGPEPAGADNRLVVGGAALTWRSLPTPTLPDPAAVLARSAVHALTAGAAARRARHRAAAQHRESGRRGDARRAAEAGFTVGVLDDDGVAPERTGPAASRRGRAGCGC